MESNNFGEADAKAFLESESALPELAQTPQDVGSFNEQDANEWLREEKYGSAGQQALSFVEGAGVGATFGLSTGLQTALGVDPEDIRGRAETNPLAHGIGEAAGFGASLALPGMVPAKLVGRAGQAAAAGLGLAEGIGTASKIGSMATKLAVESAAMAGGSEVSKMILSDPNQSVQTAALNIGLSGILGGAGGAAIGSVSPLWKATAGPKMDELLKTITNKVNGLNSVVPKEILEGVQQSGMQVSPEVLASMSDMPLVRNTWQTLQESATKSGLKSQQALKDFKRSASEGLVEALGKDPKNIGRLSELSEHETGAEVVSKLSNSIKGRAEPIIEEFNNIRNKFSKIGLKAEDDVIADRLANLAEVEYGAFKSGTDYKFIQQVLGDVKDIGTLEDLRKLQSNLWNEAKSGKVSWEAVGKVVGELRDIEGNAILRAAGAEGTEEVMRVQMARSAYRDLAQELTEVNKYLKLKKWRGPESFLEALGEAGEEGVLRKLSAENNVRMVEYLKKTFPEAANDIREYHLNDLIRETAKHVGEDEVISSKRLFTKLKNMSPEMRDFIITPEGRAKIDSIGTLLEALPSKMNSSGTAKTLDSLWQNVPASAIAVGSMVLGNNPAIALVLGAAAKYLGRDVPDAMKLGVLKFLGKQGPIDSEGFKAAVDFISEAIKGETMLNRAVGGVFKGEAAIAHNVIPDDRKLEKLDRQLEAYEKDPSQLFEVGGKTSYYMPEAGTAMAQTSMNAVNYLNSLRPKAIRKTPLDPVMEPNQVEKAVFKRALTIAQQPLVVMDSIKMGTITPQDINTLKTLYPELYQSMSSKLYDKVIKASDKKENIPYVTRMGISTFVGQALDSTMLPESIIAAQPMPEAPQQQQQAAPQKKVPKDSFKKLTSLYQTPQNARVLDKMN